MLRIIHVCLIFLATIYVKSQLFTSIEYLRKAIKESPRIFESLEDFIRLEENRLNQLKSLNQYLKLRHHNLFKNPDDVIGNPLKIFQFVKLYGIDLRLGVEDYVSSSSNKKVRMIMERRNMYLPSREDVEGVTHGIARLQRTYKLSVEKIANGSINGHPIDNLSAKDCNDIGDQMLNAGYMSYSHDWFKVSIKKMKEGFYCYGSKGKDLVSKGQSDETDITSHIALIEKKRSMANKKLKEQRRNFIQDLDALSEDLFTPEWKEAIRKDFNEGKIEFFGTEIPFNDNFDKSADALCRGDIVPRNMPDHTFYCAYHNKHPLLILQPAKLEVLNGDPLIFMYHDIITDRQIKSLKEDVFSQLKQANVYVGDTSNGTVSENRVSRSHYLLDNHKTIRSLYRYTEAVTGLKMSTKFSEFLQVVNYGIGGHYVPHYDFFNGEHVDLLDKQQRLATLLFYLSDVQAGGATVFPQIGVRIPPIKGAAAFWFNIDIDLHGRVDTLHAGCPVLLGSKWIANKWITVAEQKLGCYNL